MEIPASRSEPNSLWNSLTSSSNTKGPPPKTNAVSRGSRSTGSPRISPNPPTPNRRTRWAPIINSVKPAITADLRFTLSGWGSARSGVSIAVLLMCLRERMSGGRTEGAGSFQGLSGFQSQAKTPHPAFGHPLPASGARVVSCSLARPSATLRNQKGAIDAILAPSPPLAGERAGVRGFFV